MDFCYNFIVATIIKSLYLEFGLFKNFLLVTILSVLFSACASPPRYDYVKQGASQYEKTNAMSECNYKIKLNKTAAEEQGDLLNLCMQGKGFRYVRIH